METSKSCRPCLPKGRASQRPTSPAATPPAGQPKAVARPSSKRSSGRRAPSAPRVRSSLAPDRRGTSSLRRLPEMTVCVLGRGGAGQLEPLRIGLADRIEIGPKLALHRRDLLNRRRRQRTAATKLRLQLRPQLNDRLRDTLGDPGVILQEADQGFEQRVGELHAASSAVGSTARRSTKARPWAASTGGGSQAARARWAACRTPAAPCKSPLSARAPSILAMTSSAACAVR